MARKSYPYLLRELAIERVNQVSCSDGFVTLPGSGQKWATANSISRLGDRSLPVRHRFGSELPEGRSGERWCRR